MRRGTDALLVFARNPVAGRVKTRLAATLGVHKSARIYRRLLQQTLATATSCSAVDSTVWIADERPNSDMQTLLDEFGLAWHPQLGDDLGERMCRAIAAALDTVQRVVLIGSDCPEFTPPYIDNAFSALDDADVVLGPAADGGYVLIGMRRAHPALFADIPWGSSTVLDATREHLRALDLVWRELPTLHDVDTADDLTRFAWLSERPD